MTQLPGPADIGRHQLPNGLTVLTLQRPDLPFVCLSLEVPAGSKLDPSHQAGLAAMTAAGLRRGTRQRGSADLFTETDSLGMELSSTAGADVAAVDVRSLSEDLPRALAITAEVLLEPAFPEDEINKLRQETLARLQEAENNPDYMAERELRRQVFPDGHPYRTPISGLPATVGKLTVTDLKAFHRRHYSPSAAVLAAVGNFEPDKLLPLVEKEFGLWQAPDGQEGKDYGAADPGGHYGQGSPNAAAAGFRGTSPGQPVRIHLPGKSQSEIALGGLAPPRSHPHYEALAVANLILGRMGLGGRIGANVRERLGMAYSAYSTLVIYQQAGMWMVRAGVAPDNVDQVVAAVLDELAAFRAAPVTEQELADAKGFLLGSLPLRLEQATGLLGSLLSMERHRLGLDYLQRYPQIIGSLTATDLLTAVQEHIQPTASTAVVAGPSPQTAVQP